MAYPLAAKAVSKSFYVDDCLAGADTVDEAIELQRQLHDLFQQVLFLLRKWNTSVPAVLEHVPPDLKESSHFGWDRLHEDVGHRMEHQE